MAFVFRLRTSALERLERLYAADSYATEMMQAILIGEVTPPLFKQQPTKRKL